MSRIKGNDSLALKFAALPDTDKRAILQEFTPEEQEMLLRTWAVWARPNQLIPRNCTCHNGSWRTWLILAGRGWGKTRTGAEAVREWAEKGETEYITLAASKALDIRDVMVEGESGILAISPNSFRPLYEPSKRRLTWPNGVKALLLSADEPDTFRGPQCGKAWADELAKWPYPEAWTQMMFGLRLGSTPQVIVTTTPRPTALIRDLMRRESTHVTRGTTYDNQANLAKAFLEEIIQEYEGTRMGRQEIWAEMLDDNPGALWKRTLIDSLRVRVAPKLRRIAVGVDPAITANEKSDETGIVTFGYGDCKCSGGIKPELHGFVMRDDSDIYTPDGWATRVGDVYRQTEANMVVAEINKGGDLVVSNLRTNNKALPVVTVRATRGKQIRAEPIAALYEQRKIHHVGSFPELEDQLCDWNPLTDPDSPDRLDAMVWAASYLMLGMARPIYEKMGSNPIQPRRGGFH